ncbi:FecR family protein [Novosphingobium resinovorum]|uniref:FecR family protein n=1 Tax=Novosphingobium resinovorum TaxID=158500 RepID=UPI002ED26AA9|nr:FecR domain-containing protein [Novosphingobium resinovorum]
MANDMAIDEKLRDEAAHWAVRAGDPAFDDWEAFTLWLEADPAHARAYDAVTAAVDEAAACVASSAPANDDVSAPPRRRRPWLASAIAASVAVVGAVWAFQGERRDLYTVATPAGETTRVTLDADTRVDVAGGSAVEFDRKDKRYARLAHGQALFTVRHDAAHPFEVRVGDERLVDIGTVFDVASDAGGLSVAVSEGAVQFDPDGADVRVSPGQVLRRPAGSDAYTLTRLPAEQVGEWREGRLTFEAASIEDVAARLSRATGIAYVAAAKGEGAVSGSILVAPLRKDPAAIGPLLGLAVRADHGRWVIGAR